MNYRVRPHASGRRHRHRRRRAAVLDTGGVPREIGTPPVPWSTHDNGAHVFIRAEFWVLVLKRRLAAKRAGVRYAHLLMRGAAAR
jgi:hypothetical protein